MNITVLPSQLKGRVEAPPSKSDVHRAIICAALSKGISTISPVALSNDIKATIACAEALGAETSLNNNVLTIDGSGVFSNKKASLDCFESGSTLRFFVPIAAAGGVEADFTGHGSLVTRPIGLFSQLLPDAGVRCVTDGTLPLSVSGRLAPGDFRIPGNISSQFVTGLLFALPMLENDSRIILTSPLQSEAYVDMTINTMSKFGVKVQKADYGYFIEGNQSYRPVNYTTDGDWSQAAFFLAAGAVSGDVEVCGVSLSSTQGDKEIVSLLKKFGADVQIGESSVRVRKSALKAVEIDARQIPDIVPILSVIASFADGTTRIYGAERLRIKESDRLKTTASMLNSMGGSAEETPDGLIIKGKALGGGQVNGSNDHRIVMSAAVAALGCADKVEITDKESINKSYPNFFEEYERLGGKIYV